MTKLERNKQKVLNWLNDKNYLYLDRWNNYHYTNIDNLRLNPKKSVIRKEKKINGRWILIKSCFYKDIVKSNTFLGTSDY